MFKELSEETLKAKYQVAMMLLKGDGVPQDENKAVQILEEFAHIESDFQCRLAIVLRRGEAKKVDQEKAFQMFNDVIRSDSHNGKALFNIAQMLHHGEGTEKNKKEALVYYKKAADAGYKKAIIEYADLVGVGYIGDVDKVEAYKYNMIGLFKGYTSCIKSLAYDLLNKDHPFYNPEEAGRYWKYLAFKGAKNDIVSYAIRVVRKQIKGDFNECIDKLKSAADENDIGAIQQLLEVYNDGPLADKELYIKYMKMGADADDAQYQFEYGKMLLKGEDVPQDTKKALKYIKKASKNYETKARKFLKRYEKDPSCNIDDINSDEEEDLFDDDDYEEDDDENENESNGSENAEKNSDSSNEGAIDDW